MAPGVQPYVNGAVSSSRVEDGCDVTESAVSDGLSLYVSDGNGGATSGSQSRVHIFHHPYYRIHAARVEYLHRLFGCRGRELAMAQAISHQDPCRTVPFEDTPRVAANTLPAFRHAHCAVAVWPRHPNRR
jgi:hypothetical protein